MHRFSILKRQTIEVWRRFKLLFIIYFLFCICWIVSEYYRVELECAVEGTLGEGFVLSWQSSLFQDLLFFGLTGFLGLVLSTRLPHEENFETRSNVLANALNVGPEAKRFVREALGDLMVFNKTTTITIHVERFNAEDQIAAVFCTHENTLRNMCSDQPFKFPVSAYVIPGPSQNGEYGYLSKLSFEDKVNMQNSISVHGGGVRHLDKTGFEYDNRLVIAPDGTLVQKLEYLIYCKTDNDKSNPDSTLFFKSQMFTEKFTVQIVNKTGIDLRYTYSYPDRRRRSDDTNLKLITESGKVSAKKKTGRPSTQNDRVHLVVNNKYMHRQDRFEISLYV
ncbi:hypothetical protein DYBT9623_04436 [Dyadobacter sp. CECT 9623]|uniref:SMODS-associating 2TM beta-strand rich effector domain-containing protein n=1 Tax=Dyadobacter linearis TaxID=2823330 RepID=A0ABM8UVT8_9BACT|nr:hypothetical protein [Dyadobacter sp. CECT 9623]CAG5072898.1 hypothetical protein DYBT9623_04436 [Dyadobacter sp. CECT 9623]